MTAFTVQRWMPEGITPLEVWDLPVGGELLYRRLGTERIDALRSQGCDDAAIDLELGTVLAEAVGILRERYPGRFQLVVLSGGLAQRAGLVEAARRRLPVELRVRPEPNPHPPAMTDVVVELGQTSLKLSCGSAFERRDRSLEALPIVHVEDGSPALDATVRLGKSALVFCSFAAASFVTHTRPRCPPSVVLALPCALSATGVPSPCTYAGIDVAWPARLVEQVLKLIPRGHWWRSQTVTVRLVNDAEWAAYLAQQSGIAQDGIAITLGFGPGAALFRGVSSPPLP